MYGNSDWQDLDIDGKGANGDGSPWASHSEDEYSWKHSTTYHLSTREVAKYQFNTEEELITSTIFQKCLGQALAHKDNIIRQLQEEILNGK